MPRTHRATGFLSIVLAGLLATLAASRAQAVTISISPADTTVQKGDTFMLRVMIDGFPDLKAYQLVQRFQPAVLHYNGPLAGDVLTGSGSAFTVEQVADDAAPVDSAWTDCAVLGGNTSGPGVLLYLRFKALDFGNSLIECLDADLRDSLNQSTLPTRVGGIVRVIGPVPTRPTTWGRLKSVYR